MIYQPYELKKWREHLKLTQEQAAKILDIHPQTYRNYERGVRYDEKKAVLIPRCIGLSCAAILMGLHQVKLSMIVPRKRKKK